MPCRSAIKALIGQEFFIKEYIGALMSQASQLPGAIGGDPTGRRKALKSLRIDLNTPSPHPCQICYQR